MITRILLAASLLGSAAFAAEQAPKSDICFTAPAGWARTVDPNQHLLSLIPARGASVTFAESVDFAGTPEEWLGQVWNGMQQRFRIKIPTVSGQRGEFSRMSAVFDRPDGSPLWVQVYSTVRNGRSSDVMFFATTEALFQQHRAAVDAMIDGVTFASSPAMTSTAPAAAPTEPAVQAELNVPVPPGWTSQVESASHVTYLIPPNAPSARDAALVVLPALAFGGTAAEFHQQEFARATAQAQLLEPVHSGQMNGFQMSGVHCRNAQGVEVWMALYTARWGTQAQALLWMTDRQDLFTSNVKAVVAAVRQTVIPAGAPVISSTNTNSPWESSTTVPVPAASNPAAAPADSSDTMPVLVYSDPPNFWRAGAGGKSYAEYQGSDINFTLCIYPFREFRGDIRALFQQSMLRDWIDVMYREEGVAGQPRVVANTLVGADTVIDAHFNDARTQEHHRLVVVSGLWAAIVDMIAPTAFAYQKGFPSVLEMLKTMHVGQKPAPPSLANGPGPAGARLAGLFQGFKGKFTVNLQLGVGYGSPKTALHFFLFSPDGRVYRCYDFPPGGSEAAARNFDFDSAERQDPQNSGRYAVRGNELYIKFGGPNVDEITTTLTDFNSLQLDSINYQRKL